MPKAPEKSYNLKMDDMLLCSKKSNNMRERWDFPTFWRFPFIIIIIIIIIIMTNVVIDIK